MVKSILHRALPNTEVIFIEEERIRSRSAIYLLQIKNFWQPHGQTPHSAGLLHSLMGRVHTSHGMRLWMNFLI